MIDNDDDSYFGLKRLITLATQIDESGELRPMQRFNLFLLALICFTLVLKIPVWLHMVH